MSGFEWNIEWCVKHCPEWSLWLNKNFFIEKEKGNFRITQWGQSFLDFLGEEIETLSISDYFSEVY